MKKKPLPKRAPTKPKVTPQKVEKPKVIKAAAKPKTIKRTVSSSNSDSSEKNDESSCNSKTNKKRKRRSVDSKTEFKDLVVRKRMASLNASAMLAASYEVERHLDRCDSLYNGSSAESRSATPTSPKKIKDIKNEVDDTKEVIF